MLNKIDKALTVLEIAVSGVICAAMLIVTCMIVIWRYILVQPLPWGEEAARYLMIWFVFIGCPLAAKPSGRGGFCKHAAEACKVYLHQDYVFADRIDVLGVVCAFLQNVYALCWH